MKYKIILTEKFQKQAKRLLSKYSSLKQELADLNIELEKSPNLGTSLGKNVFKIRLAIKSKGKGKSGALESLPI